MLSAASRVMSRLTPDMPSTLNIAQSLGRPEAAMPKLSRPPDRWSSMATRLASSAGGWKVVEHGDAGGVRGGMMVGQQEPARSEANVLGLHQRLRDQQVGRGMRLP